MKINYYYNLTCPHCYVAYQNMLKALNNLEMNPKINFIPTNARGCADDSIKEMMVELKLDLKFLEVRKNTDFVNKVMLYTSNQKEWFELIAHEYFYNGLDIEDKNQVKQYFSQVGLSNRDLEKIEAININDHISSFDSNTLQIGEYNIEGVKEVGYYEFAFSCFYHEEREVEIEIGECFCHGKYCE